MNTTSLSLLDRLKRAKPDAAEWHRLQEIYLPLIRYWLSSVAWLRDEADDLSQEVFVVLIRKLPSFVRQHDGAFRAWLRTITVNQIRRSWNTRLKRPLTGQGDDAEQLLSQLEDPNSDLSKQWDRDHDKHVSDKLLALIHEDFSAQTWQAFTRIVFDGVPAGRVAKELGMTMNAVVQAKARVLKRLREEAGELLD